MGPVIGAVGAAQDIGKGNEVCALFSLEEASVGEEPQPIGENRSAEGERAVIIQLIHARLCNIESLDLFVCPQVLIPAFLGVVKHSSSGKFVSAGAGDDVNVGPIRVSDRSRVAGADDLDLIHDIKVDVGQRVHDHRVVHVHAVKSIGVAPDGSTVDGARPAVGHSF